MVSSTYLSGQGYITLAPPAPYHAPLSCIYKARVGRLGSHGIIFGVEPRYLCISFVCSVLYFGRGGLEDVKNVLEIMIDH